MTASKAQFSGLEENDPLLAHTAENAIGCFRFHNSDKTKYIELFYHPVLGNTAYYTWDFGYLSKRSSTADTKIYETTIEDFFLKETTDESSDFLYRLLRDLFESRKYEQTIELGHFCCYIKQVPGFKTELVPGFPKKMKSVLLYLDYFISGRNDDNIQKVARSRVGLHQDFFIFS